ncbi:unnamed protein product, partial [Mesorhabditis spiculigera]
MARRKKKQEDCFIPSKLSISLSETARRSLQPEVFENVDPSSGATTTAAPSEPVLPPLACGGNRLWQYDGDILEQYTVSSGTGDYESLVNKSTTTKSADREEVTMAEVKSVRMEYEAMGGGLGPPAAFVEEHEFIEAMDAKVPEGSCEMRKLSLIGAEEQNFITKLMDETMRKFGRAGRSDLQLQFSVTKTGGIPCLQMSAVKRQN